ncbi:retinol dehydrogenase 12 [Microdochium nivale]|nr:retinol dehydrogenase 12 [Microdochium nivale]
MFSLHLTPVSQQATSFRSYSIPNYGIHSNAPHTIQNFLITIQKSSTMRRTTLFPIKPQLTEKTLPDQSGKVFMVTGGSSGVGKELVGILYQHNARIYIATRSQSRCEAAMAEIRAAHPSSRGQLIFLSLQLDDLATIKATAQDFLSRESRLDVLWNNAGVMEPPAGSKTKQGYELQLGTNVLGHFMLTELLQPALVAAARVAPAGSVRVVVVSSVAADVCYTPVLLDNMDYHRDESATVKYQRSKAGNTLHAVEYARRHAQDGILCVATHPGLLATNLQNNFSPIKTLIFNRVSSPAINGAYTELYAGLDQSITKDNTGCWVVPYGQVEAVRKVYQDSELGLKYWSWMEEQVKPYM